MKFHDKLYTLRKDAQMTQNDLAEKLNVSRQAVSRWEMGTAMPDVDNLIAISDLFSVTLDELLRNKEETPVSEDQQSDEEEAPKDPFLPWLRGALFLAAFGLACGINAAGLRLFFDKPFLFPVMISGFAVGAVGLLALIILIVWINVSDRE